ncbi:MAG: hypothetical protein SFY69_03625 [Planctomycetota bacterium]|nr:hypothetical protein [Planctomycetota bacterium]
MNVRTLLLVAWGVACSVACSAAWAQSTQPPIEKPAENAGEQPAEKPGTPPASPGVPPLPTLDELLGLPPAREPAPDAPKAEDATRTELDRQLTAGDVADDFNQAVQLMSDAARRLETARDKGPQTQRVQDEAIKRLDKLIDEAQRQASRSKSKSKSRQQQPQPGEGDQPQRQSTQADASSPSAEGGEPSVPRQDGAGNPPRASGGASWGNLPEHVRQALTQGQSDKFSALYQRMTEEYYKRLAEEAGRRR